MVEVVVRVMVVVAAAVVLVEVVHPLEAGTQTTKTHVPLGP